MEDSEYHLIKAIGNGDHEAFERLVKRYQGRLLRFVFNYIGDRQTSEDLVQDVFLRVYRASPDFEPRGKVSTWIFKIAFNLCLNEIKRRKRHRCVHDDTLFDQDTVLIEERASEDLKSSEDIEEVLNALGELTENQRAALLLRAGEGLSYREIGKVLSLSVSSVESLIFRARTRLKDVLKHSRSV